MLDHVNIAVSDLQRSTAFYLAVLVNLDLNIVHREEDAIGFGDTTWKFGIIHTHGEINCIHVAFSATSDLAVQRFHATALQAGGQDNGSPGIRAEYGKHYYAAYILDPDGHNIEAVSRLSSAS